MLSQDKKGVSIMIGYVLLVVFAIIISTIVFVWLRTYVPGQALDCPEGTSVFVSQLSFNDSFLNMTIKNNGRFNIAGYFITIKNSSTQEQAIIDLSGYLNESFSGKKFANSILFTSTGDNSFKPGNEKTHIFDIPSELGEPFSIRIIPTRFQEEEGKERFVSCGNARVEQIVGEAGAGIPVGCVPDCTGRICGPDPVCGESCGDCVLPDICDLSGQCVLPEECTDTCLDYGYSCGNWTICGATTDCGTCDPGFECNATGQCVSTANNGVCDPEETCADADCEGQQNGCAENYVCESGSCVLEIPDTITNCGDYCVFLGSYTGGNCRQNPAQCTVNNEIYESGGDQYCPVGVTDNCCCIPTEQELAYFGFESGEQGWTDPGFDSGRSSSRSFVDDSGVSGGTYSWHIQDNSASSYTQQSFDLTGYSEAVIEWYGYYNSFESGDCLDLKIDGLTIDSWGTGGCQSSVAGGSWSPQSATILSSEFTFDSSVTIRFEGEMNSNYDDFYFDGFKITGIT